ncbi:cytochrome P450 [Hypoxylon trugodes]|uniref:cytochrome P450 n=1 Tax=Hypoxylon trugodes TaxID=326681 RepID=UPI00219DD856|nr:cytochrome P450 [Hypoxylon trugodes]KAI1394025.1 cytochrome P450 [Hypoxylon trugodes]
MNATDIAYSTAKYTILIAVPYFLLLLSYRVFFHPLRKYPGPLIAKVSDAYAGYYAISKRLHLTTYLDIERYGPVLRHGPNRLVFSTAQAVQDIYNNERVTKGNVYGLTVRSGKPSIFNAIDKRKHRNKRRVVGQAINDKAMRAFEPTMMDQIDVFLGQLLKSSHNSSPIDISDRSKRLGMDIVGQLAFGYALDTQTVPTNQFMIDGLKAGQYRNNCFMQFPFLKKSGLDYLVLLFAGASQRMKYLQLFQRMISNRLTQDKHAKNDLYSFVVDHLDDTDGVPLSDLWSEALFFFPAGGDTTATAISALFFYLSRNPNVYNKLADEIRTTFGSAAEIRTSPQLSSCQYLRACIDEALRMTPPVSGTPWRELYDEEWKNGPFIVDGHVVPRGTQVGVSMYAVHHNEKYFPEPFVFRPERWLDADEATLSRMNAAFSPFSIGGRGCAGKAMAYLESSLVIAKTLWYFDFEKAPGKLGEVGGGVLGKTDGRGRPEEFQLWDCFGSLHDGPNLIFHPRGDFCSEINIKAPTNP